VCAARRGENLPQQQPQPLGAHPGGRVVRADELGRALSRGPLPAGPDHHRGPGTGPQVVQLAGAAADHEADGRLPGEGMAEHPGVDHRRLDRPVGPQRGHDDQAVFSGDEAAEVR
jgi:hypothetical protein